MNTFFTSGMNSGSLLLIMLIIFVVSKVIQFIVNFFEFIFKWALLILILLFIGYQMLKPDQPTPPTNQEEQGIIQDTKDTTRVDSTQLTPHE